MAILFGGGKTPDLYRIDEQMRTLARERDQHGAEFACPKCRSSKTTIAGRTIGHTWVQCDSCKIRFSIDDGADPRQRKTPLVTAGEWTILSVLTIGFARVLNDSLFVWAAGVVMALFAFGYWRKR